MRVGWVIAASISTATILCRCDNGAKRESVLAGRGHKSQDNAQADPPGQWHLFEVRYGK